jgi:hypothetical protein
MMSQPPSLSEAWLTLLGILSGSNRDTMDSPLYCVLPAATLVGTALSFASQPPVMDRSTFLGPVLCAVSTLDVIRKVYSTTVADELPDPAPIAVGAALFLPTFLRWRTRGSPTSDAPEAHPPGRPRHRAMVHQRSHTGRE